MPTTYTETPDNFKKIKLSVFTNFNIIFHQNLIK